MGKKHRNPRYQANKKGSLLKKEFAFLLVEKFCPRKASKCYQLF
jgi:hypothetical protein